MIINKIDSAYGISILTTSSLKSKTVASALFLLFIPKLEEFSLLFYSYQNLRNALWPCKIIISINCHRTWVSSVTVRVIQQGPYILPWGGGSKSGPASLFLYHSPTVNSFRLRALPTYTKHIGIPHFHLGSPLMKWFYKMATKTTA